MNQSECFKEILNLKIDSDDIEFLNLLAEKHIDDLKPVQKKIQMAHYDPYFIIIWIFI